MTLAAVPLALLLAAFPADPAPVATPHADPASPASVVEESPDAEASVIVIHDLADVSYGDRPSKRRLSVPPFLPQEDSGAEDETGLDARELVQMLVYDCVAPDAFEYEGRGLYDLDDGRLMVVAPPALQEVIGGLVEDLRAALGRKARVAVDVFRPRPGWPMPEVLDAAAVAEAEGAGALELVHRRVDQVRLAVTERFDDVLSTTVVGEWEGEIAQNSAVSVPDLAELETGLSLVLRVEDVPGSSDVRVRHAVTVAQLRDLGTRAIGLRHDVTLQNSVDGRSVDAKQDLPVVAGASMVGSAVLPVGAATVLAARTDTLAGESAWIVRLAVVDVDAAPGPFRAGESELAFLDTSAARWESYRPRDVTARQLAGRQGESTQGLRRALEDSDFPAFPAEGQAEWEGPFQESLYHLFANDESFDPWDDGSFVWTHDGPWALLGDAGGRIGDRLRTWEQVVGTRRGVVVEVGVDARRPGGGAPVPRARTVLGVESGWAGQLLVGDTVWLPRGIEVDVAQGASIANPQVAEVFDGLSVVARASGDGTSVEIEVASAALLAAHGELLTSMSPVSFTRPAWRLSDTRVRVPADGRRRVVAEQVGGRDGETSRTLWVSVRPR